MEKRGHQRNSDDMKVLNCVTQHESPFSMDWLRSTLRSNPSALYRFSSDSEALYEAVMKTTEVIGLLAREDKNNHKEVQELIKDQCKALSNLIFFLNADAPKLPIPKNAHEFSVGVIIYRNLDSDIEGSSQQYWPPTSDVNALKIALEAARKPLEDSSWLNSNMYVRSHFCIGLTKSQAVKAQECFSSLKLFVERLSFILNPLDRSYYNAKTKNPSLEMRNIYVNRYDAPHTHRLVLRQTCISESLNIGALIESLIAIKDFIEADKSKREEMLTKSSKLVEGFPIGDELKIEKLLNLDSDPSQDEVIRNMQHQILMVF